MANGAGSGISKFHPFERVGFQTIGWALKDGDESKYNLGIAVIMKLRIRYSASII